MHLKPNIDIMNFLNDVKKCRSSIYFETPDGDSLVLNSVLSQYIFCSIVTQPNLLDFGTIRFSNNEDQELLQQYLCK